ncbi:hypothetical protein C6341_g26271 [Phytophthora cactorum]|nr:hypothetical protein C6341_g26271 [Phytophthora cactorum]
MQNSTMSDENFAAGLAWIACREGDDLELSQDDRAANARKTSPWTSYVEVQKSNSKHKAKAFASRKRSRDTSDNESDSLAPPPKHPASGKQSVSRPITKSLAASNAPLLLQGKQLQPHPWFARQHRQIELESADVREALNLANVVASIQSSDDESEDVPVAPLVVQPPLVASGSPREAVSEVPASLSVDVSELQQSLVPPNDQGFDHDLADDAESDAESMSTLVPPAAPAAPVPAGDSAPVAEESSTIDDADLLQFFARVATASETSEASGFSTS